MCWFHMQYNIRKRKVELGKKYSKVQKMIHKLHFTTNQSDFDEKYQKYKVIWIKWGLLKINPKTLKQKGFVPYFEKLRQAKNLIKK